MATEITATSKYLVLPEFVHTRQQVYDLLTEVLRIEEFLYSANTRQSGSKMSLPKTTGELDKFAQANKRNVLNHGHRLEMAKFLREVYKRAPEVSLYVSNTKNSQLVEGVAEWFRHNVHAQTLFVVSQLTKVGVGCVVRIKHKTYDFSLGKQFDKANQILREALQPAEAQTSTTQRASYL